MNTLPAIFRTVAAMRIFALAIFLAAWALSLTICFALKSIILIYFS